MGSSEMRDIATERLTLEPLVRRHAARLYVGLSDPRLYTFIDEPAPTSEAALAERYTSLERRASPDATELWLNWALKKNDVDEYLGYVQATVCGREAIVAYVLVTSAWGCGYGREAVRGMLAYLANELAIERFVAFVDPHNTKSRRLLEKIGFLAKKPELVGSPQRLEFSLESARFGPGANLETSG